MTTTPEPALAPLIGFTLVDATNQAVLARFSEDVWLELDDPDNGSFGVRVDTGAGVTIGSVRLELSGQKTMARTENWAPYSLYGDDGSGLHGASLPAGGYTLRATAYPNRGLQGNALGTLEVSFTVTASEPATTTSDDPAPEGAANQDEGPLQYQEAGTTDFVPDVLTYQVLTDADSVVPLDWDLTPSGLNTGNKFRLLFVTFTGRAPTSTDIDDYNDYVQSQANAGSAHSAIKPYASGFRVVGSTADVNARDNTSTTWNSSNRGVPIYWLNGSKVADDYADFYDGSWDDEANRRGRNGNGPQYQSPPFSALTGSDRQRVDRQQQQRDGEVSVRPSAVARSKSAASTARAVRLTGQTSSRTLPNTFTVTSPTTPSRRCSRSAAACRCSPIRTPRPAACPRTPAPSPTSAPSWRPPTPTSATR